MVDTLVSELGDTEALIAAVHAELVALRGAYGRLTVEKFSHCPTLGRVCGGGTLLDAFLRFERELQRYIRQGNRNEAAAALSIAGPAETVLDRLEEVVSRFEEDGQSRDQRTARRWSDQGMRIIATELVHLADVQRRLGSELLEIEFSGTYEGGVSMVIWHLTTRHHEERAPLIHIWKYRNEADAEQVQDMTYDLDEAEGLEATKGPYRVKRHDFKLDLPKNLTLASVDAGDAVYHLSIEGRDAPLRSVSFVDGSNLGDSFSIKFTANLTDAIIEVVKRSPQG